MKYQWKGVVDEQWGTITPVFSIDGEFTSGKLKYLHSLKGRIVRVTIETYPFDQIKDTHETH